MQLSIPIEKLSCPRCGSTEISKSRRRGVMEKYLSNVMQMRPYRCYECSLRFWKKRAAPDNAQKPAMQAEVETPQSFY